MSSKSISEAIRSELQKSIRFLMQAAEVRWWRKWKRKRKVNRKLQALGNYGEIPRGNEKYADDITEDRMLSLWKWAEIDSKYFVTFTQNDDLELKQSLHRLGNMFADSSHFSCL